MCTGRYERLSTRTFEFRTDIAAVGRAGYLRPRPVSIFLSLSGSLRLASPAQHGATSGPRLVQPPEPRAVRGVPDLLGRLRRLARDREHRIGEAVKRFLGLRLRRLDHERALHDQREID